MCSWICFKLGKNKRVVDFLEGGGAFINLCTPGMYIQFTINVHPVIIFFTFQINSCEWNA